MSRNKKGFTLIELLVVIAIIGILASVVLASLNSARRKSRDARRIADIDQMRTALALYAENNSSLYPPGTSLAPLTAAGSCGTDPCLPASPQDPLNSGSYVYTYQARDATGAACPASPCTSYVLRAVFEENHPALQTDTDGTVGGVDCGANPEVSPNWFYCKVP